jgi:hypothetical protein
MSTLRKITLPWIAITGIVFAILIGAEFMIHAQSGQPPYILFQNAALTGSGNTINATRIPVVTASGTTVYEDMALQFTTDANGNLSLAAGFPQIAPSAALLTSNFKAGTYAASSTIFNGKNIVVVSGPGVTAGGATQWSLTAGPGADPCTTPVAATWYEGPIANNPYATQINSFKITSTAMSYGIGGGGANTCPSSTPGIKYQYWANGSLLGFSQNGNSLTIVTFDSSNNNVPLDTIVLTLQ